MATFPVCSQVLKAFVKHLWLFCRAENFHSFWSKDKALEKYKFDLKEFLVSTAICIQKEIISEASLSEFQLEM